MKLFKYCILLLTLTVLSPYVAAQQKVVERSERKAPDWYGGTQSGYIIATAQNADIERAKQQCMDIVRRQILEAVAQNVTSETSNVTNQKSTASMIDFVENFTAKSETQAANLPFLKGISPSKIKEFYWEKLSDKKTGVVLYNYSIKYPFSTAEHRTLVAEFERYDTQMYDKLKELERGLETITEVEQIATRMAAIDPLIAYFFDSSRRAEASALKTRYSQLYARLSIKILENTLGNASYALVYGGRIIKTATRPILKSQCAIQIEFAATDENTVDLKYDYSGCVAGEENFIDVAYRFGATYVSQKIFFDVKAAKVQIYPTGKILLSCGAKSDSTIADVQVKFSFDSKFATDFTVESITLYVPEIVEPLVFDSVGAKISGAGLHSVEAVSGAAYTLSKARSATLNIVRGVMEVKNTLTGAKSAVKLMLPYDII